MKPVYIVSAKRTPIGSFMGFLNSFSATQLGAEAIKSVLSSVNLDPKIVEEVFMGNVLSANIGQAPARQAAIFAGLSNKVIATTINKVCASGMKSIMLGAQSIQLGINDVVIAGGMESMSNVPFYLDKFRKGNKLGHQQLIDGVIKDGLWEVYNDFHMGSAAELLAKKMNISRMDQDQYAIQSYQKAQIAINSGIFDKEICKIVSAVKGIPIEITKDEEPFEVNFDKIPLLKPVFDKEGSVTAANASSLNDGAAAVLLMSEAKLKELNLQPLAEIVSYADAAQAPELFTTSPSIAIPKALKNANMSIQNVEYFEINEAFSVVALANMQLLNIDPSMINSYGGAVAIGHPLGASGARIVVTLVNAIANMNKKIGVAAICNGGGGASAMVIKKF